MPITVHRVDARFGPALALASLVGALACGHGGSTDASPLTEPPETLLEWSAPSLADDPEILVVPTYDGSGQSVHPDIVDFPEGWNGSRYWLAMTPYPFDDTKRENPSLLVSGDGHALTVPAGVINPLVPPINVSGAYNSDPDLTYDAARGELVMSYRVVKDGFNTIKVITSTNGSTWSEPHVAFSEPNHSAVSQSMVTAVRSNPAMAWYVDAGGKGCGARNTRVMVRRAASVATSLGLTSWSDAVTTDLVQPGYSVWHLKVRYVPSKREYWMLYAAYLADGNGCGGDDLFLAHSKDGLHWQGFPNPILRHGDREWSFGAAYRGTFLYDPSHDELSVWFSAKSGSGVWRMLLAHYHYSALVTSLARSTPSYQRIGRGARQREIWTDAP
jgi:hypothetical protein